ncbi:RTX toxin [Candidatus Magnetomorum sp. HK-1]|nr:RTX toxin [Candidatus Magnetomorum sp. HK-1]
MKKNSILLLIVFALLHMTFAVKVFAIPSSFDWTSIDSEGVYNSDNQTALSENNFVQLIYIGPDGVIDPPDNPDDDVILSTSTIWTNSGKPPTLQNMGYFSGQFDYDDEIDSRTGSTVYVRAWNGNDVSSATHYGNSETATITSNGSHNFARWNTDTPVPVENTSPTITNPGNQTTLEDIAIQAICLTVTDSEASYLTVTALSSALTLVSLENMRITSTNDIAFSNNSYTVAIVDSKALLYLSITPTENLSGASTISMSVTDGEEVTSTSFTVSVTSVPDAPAISTIPDQTIDEGTSYSTIQLDNYVADVDTEDSEISWAFSGQSQLTITIDSNRIATIETLDNDWNGNETILFVATDPDNMTDSVSVTFTSTPVNDTPVISNIPDQSISEGSSFTSIQLDNYVSDPDHADTEISWSASGQNELTVTIANRIASIMLPDENWNGSETITFTASDPGGLTACDSIMLTVTAVNDSPVVSDISDQSITEGNSFATITLDDFVSDVDHSDSEISWTQTGETDLSVAINNRIATISTPNENWNGSETIIFTATDADGLTDADSATFTVTPVNDAPVVTDITDQTISEGNTFSSISLDNFVSDLEDADNQITWLATGQTDITITITNRVASISLPDSDWNGTETIMFTATDSEGLTAADTVIFSVTAVNDAPVITDISDQTIEEGSTFSTISLDDYISDVDNSDDQISWTATGQSDLTVSINNRIATITTPNTDWNGTETILFTATDAAGLTASNVATFTVTPVNDAPVSEDIPGQTIQEGSSFTTIQLDNYVSDTDNTDNELTWTATGQSELTVTINNRIATISIPDAEWNGNETIKFVVTDPDGLTDSDSAIFTVTEVNDPPAISSIPDQSITEGSSFSTIQLDNYASDPDNTDSEINWTVSGQSELTISIDNRIN